MFIKQKNNLGSKGFEIKDFDSNNQKIQTLPPPFINRKRGFESLKTRKHGYGSTWGDEA